MKSLAVCAALLLAQAPAAAQVRTIDPNSAIDSDLGPQSRSTAPAPSGQDLPPPQASTAPPADEPVSAEPPAPNAPPPAAPPANATAGSNATYQDQDVLDAAEGVFGRGAKGLAGLVEKILQDQGRPNAYIAGHEAAGAIGIGLRYGSGILSHKIEGQRKVFWTGPSIGFDLGGDATKVFVLVYNLYDTQDIYKRFPAVEGRVYVVGGFSATYLRRGNIVLIPVRLGVGWRLGANVGYMKFTEKSRILPF